MKQRAWTAASILILTGAIAAPTVWAQDWGTSGSDRRTREIPNLDRVQGKNRLPISVNSAYGVSGDRVSGNTIGSAEASQPTDAAGRRERRRRLANRQAGISDSTANSTAPAAIGADSQSSLINQQVQKSDYNNVVDGLMYGDDLMADPSAFAEDSVAECDGFYGYGGGLPAVAGGISIIPPDALPPLVVEGRENTADSDADQE